MKNNTFTVQPHRPRTHSSAEKPNKRHRPLHAPMSRSQSVSVHNKDKPRFVELINCQLLSFVCVCCLTVTDWLLFNFKFLLCVKDKVRCSCGHRHLPVIGRWTCIPLNVMRSQCDASSQTYSQPYCRGALNALRLTPYYTVQWQRWCVRKLPRVATWSETANSQTCCICIISPLS